MSLEITISRKYLRAVASGMSQPPSKNEIELRHNFQRQPSWIPHLEFPDIKTNKRTPK